MFKHRLKTFPLRFLLPVPVIHPMSPRIAPSDNFRNPVGLLYRMLLSGQRAAYTALAMESLRIMAKPIDAMLQFRERRLMTSQRSGSLPLLLIAGAPRSGTTLIYQTLAKYLDVSYFSNLTSLFPRSPISGTQLVRPDTSRQSADFCNFYGQTSGLHGPHDGFGIWNRWLGSDRYVPRTDLAQNELSDMRHFFEVWCSVFRKPLLNKNNRNTSCLALLSSILPNAFFVVVRRNPVMVAQSLIRAREQVQGDKRFGWGLHSTETSQTSDPLAYVDDVCRQILSIENRLNEQLKIIPEHRILELQYEDFCRRPSNIIQQIATRIPGIGLNQLLTQQPLQAFQISSSVTLSDTEHDRLLRNLGAGAVIGADFPDCCVSL